MADQPASGGDLLRRPLSFMTGWGLPLLIIISLNLARGTMPSAAIILILSGAFTWMGVACVVNALRCGRLHCLLSGPIFLIGAALILLVGFDVLSLGLVRVDHIIYATAGLVMLTFLLEWIWGASVNAPKTPGNT